MKVLEGFRLDGRVALITGAAGGLGSAIASALAEAGARLALSDIDEEGVRRTAEGIGQRGGRAEGFRHDVTREQDWVEVIAACVSTLGGLDVLVNNAGVEVSGLLTEFPLADLQYLQRVNVEAAFLGCKHAARVMSLKNGGRGGAIVNISSAAALGGAVGMSAYGATKGALRSLSRHAAVELARLGTGIRVNSIYPGFIGTAMGLNNLAEMVALGAQPDVEAAEAVILGLQLLPARGEPRDIAAGVLYLASDAGRWITGTELVIDGGLTAR